MEKMYGTLLDIKKQIESIEELGYDLDSIPVIMTDDDEMNGIHTSWKSSGIIEEWELKSMRRYTSISLPVEFEKLDGFRLFYLVS